MNNNKILTYLFVFVTIVAVVFPTLWVTTNSNRANVALEPDRIIGASGSGEVALIPDMATITVGVFTENDDLSVALSENEEKAQAIRDLAAEYGIAESDIQTSDFSIYPRNIYDESGNLSGETFAVNNSVEVKIRDLSRVSEVLGAFAESGANQIGNLEFDSAGRDQAIQTAKKLAIKDAIAQAELIADAAGVTLGDITNISADISYLPAIAYGKGEMTAMDSVSSVPISAGEMAITASSYVSYSIK